MERVKKWEDGSTFFIVCYPLHLQGPNHGIQGDRKANYHKVWRWGGEGGTVERLNG